jgi:hypothetical protein
MLYLILFKLALVVVFIGPIFYMMYLAYTYETAADPEPEEKPVELDDHHKETLRLMATAAIYSHEADMLKRENARKKEQEKKDDWSWEYCSEDLR